MAMIKQSVLILFFASAIVACDTTSSTLDKSSAVITEQKDPADKRLLSTESTGKVITEKIANEDGIIADRFKPAEGNQGGYTIETYKTVDTTGFNEAKTKLSYAVVEHDFGDINQHTENEFLFKFKNDGNVPLIIYDAKGSCGCTVPEYPKAPIAPGGENEIRVVYKPASQKGQHTKTVTITANTEPMQSTLTIKANVHEVSGN
jgi:hypothetical protein